jgi:4-amino-4-deoxy-L-arabinose transferase-like glycosyltransferase
VTRGIADPSTKSGPARRDEQRAFLVALTIIAIAGLVLRFTYVVLVRRDNPPLGDAFFYHYGAHLLVDGEGFVAPFQFFFAVGEPVQAADHPPLYLLFLSLPSFLGLRTATAHMLWSALLGTATVVVAGFLGRRVAGAAVGVIAAAIVALYPNIWAYDGALVSETLAIFVATATLLLGYRAWERPTVGRAMAVGLACGAATLARSELVLLVPGLLVPIVLLSRQRSMRERLRMLTAAVVIAGVVMAPWVIYNLTRFEHPVLLSSQLEPTLAGANCADTYEGSSLGFITNRCVADLDSTEDQSVTARIARDRAYRFVRNHVDRVPIVVAARIGRVTGLFRPGDQIEKDERYEGRERPLAIAGVVTFYPVAGGAVVGAIVLRRRKTVPLFPLLVVPAIVMLTVALTYGATRFRASAETSLAILAAVAVSALWARFVDARRSRTRAA